MVKPIALTPAKEAHDRYLRIIALKQHIEESGHSMGAELFEIKHRQQWRDLGHDSFAAFIADPYVNISNRTAYRLIRVHREYIIKILMPQIAQIENEYYPEPLPPEAREKIDWMDKRFHEDMAKAGTTKLEMAAGYIDGDVTALINSATTLSKTDFKAHLTGIEPVYKPVAWRDVLHEARNACEKLDRSDAPDEVKAFALDFWVATESYE